MSLAIDCDVLQADGGTRTAAITGAYVAVALALKKMTADKQASPRALKTQVAAVSVVMTAEGKPFARDGIGELFKIQAAVLSG